MILSCHVEEFRFHGAKDTVVVSMRSFESTIDTYNT
jgi:hypothetical protein